MELGDGDVLGERTAVVVSSALGDGIDQSLAALGHTGNGVEADGAMIGFIADSAGTPIEGGTATCDNGGTPCASFYYGDADPSDGMFSTGASANASTSAAANSMFLVPAAPIWTYEATADGYTFQSQLFGSVAGMVSVMTFYAE